MGGIRVFLPENLKTISQDAICRNCSAQMLQLNVNRNETMVVQSIALIDRLDKEINIFFMRVKNCYGSHFSILYRI